MGNAQKALVMAAGIFLAIALITIAVVMFISAQEATKTAQDNFSGIQNELSSTSFNVYDNTIVSGSQVVNALRKYDNRQEFGIQVIVGTDRPSGAWYGDVVSSTGNIATTDHASQATESANTYGGRIHNSYYYTRPVEAEAIESRHYVNPAGRFQAIVVRDTSNVVKGLVFTQQD
ncbi:ABC transporter permease [Tumebacillus sp. ITR2]|uniref:ABC transporter permease n=1 Tax=Tumebacillus amylolyticus TaxID=2801339 RepID=A0ABS1J6P5_9BACL|nr:ABC transporter permease [Tumebacillus amylolyticus]MBL0385850.1 ABC transporter permease [Tumebacillus amylolyticus]